MNQNHLNREIYRKHLEELENQKTVESRKKSEELAGTQPEIEIAENVEMNEKYWGLLPVIGICICVLQFLVHNLKWQ